MTCTTALTLVQGWEILYCEIMEKDWKEKFEDWSKKSKGAGTIKSQFLQRTVRKVFSVKSKERGKVYRGRILGRNPDKSKSFPFCYSQSPLYYSFASRFLFFKITQPLTISVKEKGGKPPSLRFTKSMQKPHVQELSRLFPETSMKLSVHEFGFWSKTFKDTHSI
jgi:hypothetical protein